MRILVTDIVRRGGILALLYLTLASSPVAAFTDIQLTSGFYKTVFGAEYSSWGWQSNIVKKYTKTVRIYIDNRSRISRTRQVTRFVNTLPGKIDGLRLQIVSNPADANYRIYVVDRAQYKAVVRNEIYRRRNMDVPGRCLVRVVSASGGIKRSDAVIVSDEGSFLFNRCLVEEVLQGLGPVNDNANLRHSIFNDNSRYTRFTKHDRYILNMLYDPRIRPGMNEKDVAAVLPKVIEDTRRRIR